jgi:hypothetical protein
MLNRKNLLYFLAFLIFINSCISKDVTLENYYLENIKLHQDLKDSLMAFSKNYNTDIFLKKSPYRGISFSIHFHDSAELIPVYFDSIFNRQDYKPERTKNFIIPKSIIENFKNLNYYALACDSSRIFFANEWIVKLRIGTQPDIQHGILITKDSTIEDKETFKIAPEVFIVNRGIE